jgi:hypothetical protein
MKKLFLLCCCFIYFSFFQNRLPLSAPSSYQQQYGFAAKFAGYSWGWANPTNVL